MDNLLSLFDNQCNGEDIDPDELSLEERIEIHLSLNTDNEIICNDINNVLEIDQKITNLINENILLDLEIFIDNENKQKNTVFQKLNKTESLFGRSYLIEMLKKPIRDIDILEQRQSIVSTIITNKKLNKLLKSRLMNFSNIESNIMWFWKEQDESMNELVYFNFPYLQFLNDFLNKNDNIMFFSNWYKIFVTPLMTIFSPLSSVIVPLVMMKIMKTKIPLKTFFKILSENLFSTKKFEAMFGNNIIAKGAAVMSAGINILFYFQSSYSSVQSSKSTYNFMSVLHDKVNMLSTILDNVESIDNVIKKDCKETYIELKNTVDIQKLDKIYIIYYHYSIIRFVGKKVV